MDPNTLQIEATGSDFTFRLQNGTGGGTFDYSHTFSDSTFTGGGIGMYTRNYSGSGGVTTFDNVMADFVSGVPEPSASLLVALAIVPALRRRRRR